MELRRSQQSLNSYSRSCKSLAWSNFCDAIATRYNCLRLLATKDCNVHRVVRCSTTHLELNATMFIRQQTNRCQKIFHPRSVKSYWNALRFFVPQILSHLLATATSLCTTIASSCTAFFLRLILTPAIIVNREVRAFTSSRTTLIVQSLGLFTTPYDYSELAYRQSDLQTLQISVKFRWLTRFRIAIVITYFTFLW